MYLTYYIKICGGPVPTSLKDDGCRSSDVYFIVQVESVRRLGVLHCTYRQYTTHNRLYVRQHRADQGWHKTGLAGPPTASNLLRTGTYKLHPSLIVNMSL